MKRILIFCLSILSCFLLVACNKEITISPLEDKYYGHSEIIELNVETFNTLLDKKESFGIFIYQPMCAASIDFENILSDFSYKQQITFYKLQFKDMKETQLSKHIEFCPSFVIYQDGKMVDYLDASSDDDVDYYLSVDGFEKWFSTYIELRTPDYIEEEIIEDIETDVEKDNKSTIDIDDLTYDENKINVYLFYGDGCTHCEDEMAYFESIEEEYGDLFTLNTFEVWHNENNEQIYREFSKIMNDEIGGVPYTIIGDKSFSGFGAPYEDMILETIISQHKNSYDVYFSNN
ncbi:MAG: thioredoxin family protein [Bacillota bacterium]|jgi:thiol-disulfide isomerase/thioredoxin|nr:thioredoxin family protein [Bacillota bacterium]